ncbi:MAG: helix-turn-helix transcriptional regulator [Candidatus Dormibacteria bacterium]
MINNPGSDEAGDEAPARVAAALGLGLAQLRIFESLALHPAASVDDLALRAGISRAEATRAIEALKGIGLVAPAPSGDGRMQVLDPDVALTGLIQRGEEALALSQSGLAHARSWARQLARNYHTAVSEQGAPAIQIIEGLTAATSLFQQFQAGMREELIGMEKPPYLEPLVENPAELHVLEQGRAHYRWIYEGSVFEVPGKLEQTLAYVAAGEEARVLSYVPTKLAVFDRSTALMPIRLNVDVTATPYVLIQESTILAALVELFARLWDVAIPIRSWLASGDRAPTGEPISDVDRRVLAMLVAGSKDRAIAQRLGLSHATVVRHVGRLMDRLGANTRFQAGVQATRRGWI